MSEEQPAVALRDLVKRYGEVEAVNGISLEIRSGEFLAIIGPSGCGKTTTLRMIAGLEVPSSGDVFIDGRRVNDAKPWKRDTPLVWQNFALFPHLSVAKNVEYGLRTRRVPKEQRKERVAEALETVGLAGYGERRVTQLSGGQKQRVGLARALVLRPKVLLLDEPLGALDAKISRSMQGELRRLQKEMGITFIYVTHNQSEALAMADRIAVMNAGKIQQVGTPQDVYRRPHNRFVAEFVGMNNIFSGRCGQRAEEGILPVETPQGLFATSIVDHRTYAPGEDVTFVVPADSVRLGSQENLGQNRITGHVSGVEIIGAVTTVFIQTPDGDELCSQITGQQREAGRVEIGDRVTVCWDTASAYVLQED